VLPPGTNNLLIRPKPGTTPQALDRFHAQQGCEVVGRFAGFGDVQVVRLPPGRLAWDLVHQYRQSGLTAYAELDQPVRLASIFPNDPSFLDGTQWALNNAGQDRGLPNADIDAPEAWGFKHDASNVIVAVVDSGVRLTHEDLAGNLWTNPRDGSHGINALTGSTDPSDDNGHGTRVAGVIGAMGNNGIGVAGVAWRVQIMACKFANSFGYGTVAGALACLDFARSNGAHIVNASWGLEDSLSLSNAMRALQAVGILVVAAAGNGPLNIDVTPHYPASYGFDNIVAVAATTRRDELYVRSNYGATNVDLAAPGDEIYSTHSRSDRAYSFDLFGQGDTSIAAAFVSGAAALLRGEHPEESPAQLIKRLIGGTDALPGLAGKCVSGGRLNLRKALGVAVASPQLEASLVVPDGLLSPWTGFELLFRDEPGDPISPFALLMLRVVGHPGRSYVIERTEDLQVWRPFRSVRTAFAGDSMVTNETGWTGIRVYYRARTAD